MYSNIGIITYMDTGRGWEVDTPRSPTGVADDTHLEGPKIRHPQPNGGEGNCNGKTHYRQIYTPRFGPDTR